MRLSLYSVDPPEPDGESVCVDPLTWKTLAPLVQRMAVRGNVDFLLIDWNLYVFKEPIVDDPFISFAPKLCKYLR